MKVFYFGPWHMAGHFIFQPDGFMSRPSKRAGPWSMADLDAQPYDHKRADTGKGVVPVDPTERQGIWRLTHRDGWTALGAWDRTCDARPGSKAVFIAEGEHDETAMKAIAAQHFPTIWARITALSSNTEPRR